MCAPLCAGVRVWLSVQICVVEVWNMYVLCYATATTGINITKCIIALPKQTGNDLSNYDKSELKTKLQGVKDLKMWSGNPKDRESELRTKPPVHQVLVTTLDVVIISSYRFDNVQCLYRCIYDICHHSIVVVTVDDDRTWLSWWAHMNAHGIV